MGLPLIKVEVKNIRSERELEIHSTAAEANQKKKVRET
jgi:hypothetical protein